MKTWYCRYKNQFSIQSFRYGIILNVCLPIRIYWCGLICWKPNISFTRATSCSRENGNISEICYMWLQMSPVYFSEENLHREQTFEQTFTQHLRVGRVLVLRYHSKYLLLIMSSRIDNCLWLRRCKSSLFEW